jgi:DNA replication protein DnaC
MRGSLQTLGSALKTTYQSGPGDVFYKMLESETRTCSDCGKEFETEWRPQRVCKSCVDRHRLQDAESLRLQRAGEYTKELERMGITARLGGMTLERFSRESQPDAYAAISDLATSWPIPKHINIALLGDRGTGKTHLGCGLLLALAETGWYGKYVYWPGLIAAVKSADDQRDAERRLLEPLKTAPAIVLDDVGRDKMTEHLEGWRDVIFDARWVTGLSTVITANLAALELHDWLGAASASRFFADATVVKMQPGDQRRQPVARQLKPLSNDPTTPCPSCGAAGWVTDQRHPVGSRDRLRRCPRCNGRGW